MKLEPTYLELKGGSFRETGERPGLEDVDALAMKIAEIEARTFKHKPGDGDHYVPAPLELLLIGGRWTPSRRKSIGAILAHADDVCRACGLDYPTLRQRAYPYEDRDSIDAEQRGDCARPATLRDLDAVLRDLRAVRFGALADLIAREVKT